MAEPAKRRFEWAGGPMLVAYAVILCATGLIVQKLVTAITEAEQLSQAAGAVISAVSNVVSGACYLAATIFFGLGIIRWAMLPYQHQTARRQQQIEAALRSINDTLMISDATRRIVFRDRDLRMLEKYVDDVIDRGEYDSALALVDQMAGALGSQAQVEALRGSIFAARAAAIEEQLSDELSTYNDLVDRREWEPAAQEGARIEKQYPNQQRSSGLVQRVRDTREAYKMDLERRFLEAAGRDDVDLAMELMKELDRYLSERDAAPFREAARGVVSKKRENLAVQFKLAVHDKQWAEAVRIGEEIVNDFTNSKMAEEVRGMIDLLRQRAAEAQAEVASRES